jgi:hypothetical protein
MMSHRFIKFTRAGVSDFQGGNMRKYSLILIIGFLFLTSCTQGKPAEIPNGVWQSQISDISHITLYFESHYQTTKNRRYLGIYTSHENKRKLFVRHDVPRDAFMQIFCISAVDENGIRIVTERPLFSGTFMVIDDELHFADMIFQRVENHEPIDPADWLPYVK